MWELSDKSQNFSSLRQFYRVLFILLISILYFIVFFLFYSILTAGKHHYKAPSRHTEHFKLQVFSNRASQTDCSEPDGRKLNRGNPTELHKVITKKKAFPKISVQPILHPQRIPRQCSCFRKRIFIWSHYLRVLNLLHSSTLALKQSQPLR